MRRVSHTERATAKSDAATQKRGKSSDTIRFILHHNSQDIRLVADPPDPDYRLFAGPARNVIREYIAQRSRQTDFFQWGGGSIGESLLSPDERILDAAADAGILYDDQLSPIAKAIGSYRIALCFDLQNNQYSVSYKLENPSGELVSDDKPLLVSPRRCIHMRTLYPVADLGPEWFNATSIAGTVLKIDAPTYLSIIFSRYTGLSLRIPGFQLKTGPVRMALPSLIFTELDAYGYLHIRPVSTVEGFKPGFFEDFDISKAISFDEENGVIYVSDIIFYSNPSERFETLLESSLPKQERQYIVESGRFILSPECASKFITASMGEIIQHFSLFQTERLDRYKIRFVKPKLHIRSISSGIDFFEASAQVTIENDTYPIGRFIAEQRRQGYLSLADGTKAFVDHKRLMHLERLVATTKQENDIITINVFDVAAIRQLQDDVDASGSAWEKAASFFDGYNHIKASSAQYSLADSALRPYQAYGSAWLNYLLEHGFGACLADDMGLGKTVQTIAFLRTIYASSEPSAPTKPKRGRPRKSESKDTPKQTKFILIVATRTLLFNWAGELKRFAPEIPVFMHHGANRSDRLPEESGIIISSYATVRNDVELFQRVAFECIILDEAQAIKNIETKAATALRSLTSKKRIALTGTPIENSVDELFSLFSFLNPGLFGTQASFVKHYKRPIEELKDEGAALELKTRIKPFILRRLKRDVLSELPPKTEQISFVELDEDHRTEYHRRRLELKRFLETLKTSNPGRVMFHTLSALSELRKLASVPESDEYLSAAIPGIISMKRRYILEQVAELVSIGHKALIFSNYLSAVENISNDLSTIGINNLVITGSTNDRATVVQHFQTDPGIGALVMTLKTGGLGLNLTAADYVFIYDPWWNAAAEAQAIDRTHRIGQENPVFCYRIIARDTIEEKILELQKQKRELADSLIDNDAALVKKLDDDDIAFLLG